MNGVLGVALAVVAVLSSATATQLPGDFQLCHQGEGFHKCLEGALSHALHLLAPGVPSFGLSPLDPMVIPEIVIGQRGGNSPVNLNLKLSNIKVRGLQNAVPSDVITDIEKYKLQCKGLAENIFVDADYVMDGKILILPITGSGPVHANLTNLQALAKIDGEEKMKKGKRHLKVTKFSIDLTGLDRLSFNFENLFNGDKTLGDSANAVINDNWQEFWADIKPALSAVMQEYLKEEAKAIFNKIPYDEIFLPKQN